MNDDLGVESIRGSCTTCLDTPNVGNHSVALTIDIGLTDKGRRTPDMLLYTLRNRQTGETRQTTDRPRPRPADRPLAGRRQVQRPGPPRPGRPPPYFHDGSAADLGGVLDFYAERFGLVLSDQERSDLIAFLNAL